MSLFSKIFGTDKSSNTPSGSTVVKLLNDEPAVFTPYTGDFNNDPDVRACVDAIARNGAKMHPRHIRNFDGDMQTLKRSNIYKLLSKKPNEIQNAYQFFYQVIANLELYNDSFIYVQKDTDLKVQGLYPIDFKEGKYYEYQGRLWIKFSFGRSKERYVPLDDCIHLTRFVGKDGLFGGNTVPIIKALSIKHVLDEGIVNAIKTTQSIKGVVKSQKALLKPEDVKKMRDQFVQDFIDSRGNKSGIGGLDATTDFIPVKIEPQTASESQIKNIDDKILKYYGLNENILKSSYTEDQWNAFYESILEPIGLQMSLEFTNKLFTPTEKRYGNEIIFESNRLQYASNNTKISLLRFANNIMTINELREVFNLAPRADGDVIMQDVNHNVMETDEESDVEPDEDINANEGDENDEGKGN